MDTANRKLPGGMSQLHACQSSRNPGRLYELKPFNQQVNLSGQFGQAKLLGRVNLDSKSQGRIIGISLKPGALERWFLMIHERADITKRIEEICGLGESEKVSHKEIGGRRHA